MMRQRAVSNDDEVERLKQRIRELEQRLQPPAPHVANPDEDWFPAPPRDWQRRPNQGQRCAKCAVPVGARARTDGISVWHLECEINTQFTGQSPSQRSSNGVESKATSFSSVDHHKGGEMATRSKAKAKQKALARQKTARVRHAIKVQKQHSRVARSESAPGARRAAPSAAVKTDSASVLAPLPGPTGPSPK